MKARIYFKNQVRDLEVRDDAQRVLLLRVGDQAVNMITHMENEENLEVVAVRTDEIEDGRVVFK